MKNLKPTIYFLAALLTVLSSCGRDDLPRIETGENVRITIGTQTRAGGSALYDERDFTLSSLRVLGYHSKNGVLAFNRYVTEFTVVSGSDTEEIVRQATLEVMQGEFTFVFIANEISDPSLGALLANDDNIPTLTRLKQCGFSYTAFEIDRDIPMFACYENVEVLADNTLKVKGSHITGAWGVGLDRLGVRAEIFISLDAAQSEKWLAAQLFQGGDKMNIGISYMPQKVYLFPQIDNSATWAATRKYAAEWDDGYGNYEGILPGRITVYHKGTPDERYDLYYARTILAEKWFADKTDASKAMRLMLNMWVDTQFPYMVEGALGTKITGPEADRDYTLARNTYLKVTATVYESPAEIEIETSVVDWNDTQIDDIELD